MGRSVLTSGQLGLHNGLPCTIIVSATLQELESGYGQAVTATGILLPMPTVIKMASPRLLLPDDLRQRHRLRAASGTNPLYRVCRPTHRAAGR
jgi:hypothetical protein